jgi:diketogulonate reductase-like aldo/keto reductase
LDEVAKEVGKTVPQVALNWLLQRPSASTVIIGAREEAQLKENIGSVGWSLTPDQIARLDKAGETRLAYPYWHQSDFAERNPPPAQRLGLRPHPSAAIAKRPGWRMLPVR